MPVTYQIAITRDAGLNGPISMRFSPLPSGVTALVSGDNPLVTSEVITVTFKEKIRGGSSILPK